MDINKLLKKLEKKLKKFVNKFLTKYLPEADVDNNSEPTVVPEPTQNEESSSTTSQTTETTPTPTTSTTPTPTPTPTSPDEVEFSKLNFCWGSFKCGSAKLDDKARISNLNVTSKGMSYKWKSGGCENLDKNCSHNNACCTCALFCLVNGQWKGGKFDHISTDRTTRDFANITDGYGGWQASALSQATAYAFVIFDDGGKKRTNVTVQKK